MVVVPDFTTEILSDPIAGAQYFLQIQIAIQELQKTVTLQQQTIDDYETRITALEP